MQQKFCRIIIGYIVHAFKGLVTATIADSEVEEEKKVKQDKRIGEYAIVDGPFYGGMGLVYRVLDSNWGDTYALKTFKGPMLLGLAHRIERFQQEVQHWLALPYHLNVITAHKAFIDRERPWLLLDWAEGGSLEKQKKLQLTPWLLYILQHICHGMSHIHQAGIVHGDLKPANVLFRNQIAAVSDLGLAHRSGNGIQAGTPGFIAPEVLSSGGVTVSSDVFAFGKTLAVLVDTIEEGDSIRQALGQIANQCCQVDPRHRYHDFSEINTLIVRLGEQIGVQAYTPNLTPTVDSDIELMHNVLADMQPTEYAQSLHAAGRLDEAEAHLRNVLTDHPESWRAWSALGSVLKDSGRAQEAAEAHLNAARINSNSVPLQLNAAGACVEADRFDYVTKITSSIRRFSTPAEEAKREFILGLLAERQGRLIDAQKYYEASLGMDEVEHVRVSLGLVCGELGQHGLAVKHLEVVAHSRCDESFRARGLLGRELISAGRVYEAIEELSALIGEDIPASERGWISGELGQAYIKLGMYEEALQSIIDALLADQQSIVLLRGIAFCLGRLGGWDQACEFYRYVAAYDESAQSYFDWGRALAEVGSLDDAKSKLYKCLAIDPFYRDAKELLEVLK